MVFLELHMFSTMGDIVIYIRIWKIKIKLHCEKYFCLLFCHS